jgi:hypothetical protein
MKKYLQPEEKITFCRVDKKGSSYSPVKMFILLSQFLWFLSLKYPEFTNQRNLRGEVSLVEQDTIDYVS